MARQTPAHTAGTSRPVGRSRVRLDVKPLLTPVAATVRRILSGTDNGVTTTSRAISRPAGAPGWFGPDSAAWQVHGDVAAFLGGIRALLLQTLHPLALAGIDGHSSYRNDPFGRLHRTGAFIAATTFGSEEMADRTAAGITRMHARVSGTAQDGRGYSATDPELLTWVHIALVDSMLAAYVGFGNDGPLDADRYVADMSVVGAAMGVPQPPRSQQELLDAFDQVRPQLTGSRHVAEVREFVLAPPLSPAASLGYGVLARAAEDSLPPWARDMLGSPARRAGSEWANHAMARTLLRTLQVALVESPAREAARHRLGVSAADMERISRRRALT